MSTKKHKIYLYIFNYLLIVVVLSSCSNSANPDDPFLYTSIYAVKCYLDEEIIEFNKDCVDYDEYNEFELQLLNKKIVHRSNRDTTTYIITNLIDKREEFSLLVFEVFDEEQDKCIITIDSRDVLQIKVHCNLSTKETKSYIIDEFMRSTII